jgi:hypothetical protein
MAILCDYAQVNNGKLYLTGAAANLVGTPSAAPPHPISVAVGILVTIPWNAHNQLHRLKVSLVSEDGAVVPIAVPSPTDPPEDQGSVLGQFNAGRPPLMQAGDDSIMPIAIPLNVALPTLGGYAVVVDIDGAEVARTKFRVLHVSQMQGGGLSPQS